MAQHTNWGATGHDAHNILPPVPPTRRGNTVDVLHGTPVTDPYRWLEDEESDETREWTAAQMARTRAVLDGLPDRDRIAARLTTLLETEMVTVPRVRGGRLFYQRRTGEQNQPILYVRNDARSPERVLLDPNTLRGDGTVALDWWYPSPDGTLLAYGLSEGGDEQSTLAVRDVASGDDLPVRIPRTRAASVGWLPDNSGFFYTRYPLPGTVPACEEQYHRHIYFHALGTDPEHDADIFGAGRSPQDWPGIDVSSDGRFLLVIVTQGWAKSEVYLCDLHGEPDAHHPSHFVAVAEGIDANFDGEVVDGVLYLTTNLDAPHYRVFAVDPTEPHRDRWRELIPERAGVALQGVAIVGQRLAVASLVNACSHLEIFSLHGQMERDDLLPALGSLAGIGGEADGTDLYFGFTSFVTPVTIYRHDLSSGVTHPFGGATVPSGVDAANYVVEQVWYPSLDGEQISMFLVRRRETSADGNRPVYLTGYGGFNISRTPAFIAILPFWLDLGGVFALPNLRGGGEYGEAWHRAGMLGQKQHVFDDVLAAAAWLIASGYTRPRRMAIHGGSNGGLLVGAAITQRPDLFRAAVCAVPLLDMLRYHHFRIARLWIAEYGSPDDPDAFQWLFAYSPYHRVRAGVSYPAVLLTTAEGDSRVDPMHARKMAAALQHATVSNPDQRPILLRVEERAGHGAGKPLAKVVLEATDVWSFLCWQLAVPVS